MRKPSEGEVDRTRASAALRDRIGGLPVGMLLLGVLAGGSVGLLDGGTVTVPGLGPVSGTLLGAAGLAVSAVVYYRADTCRCGGTDCGCAGDCGDSCSYDP